MNRRKTGQINLPTILTILRMFLAVVFMVFVLIDFDWARVTALIIFIIAAVTDKIDGYLARKNKAVTDLGAFLDPIADKMLVNLAFLALVMLGIIPVWVFAVILVRDFAVDGLRMMTAQEQKVLPASWLGKWKTGFQMTALMMLLLSLVLNFEPIGIIGNIILYMSLVLTVVSAFDYFYKSRKLFLK